MKMFLFLFFITSSVFAGNYYVAPFIIGGAAATSLVGTQTSIYSALMQAELKNWSRPETGTTVRMENQCGIETEFHLAGNHRNNVVLLGLANSTSHSITTKSNAIKFIYDNTKVRSPGYTHQISDHKVAPGWWQISWVPFPSKDEFKGVNDIRVEVPVVDEKGHECIVTTNFKRTKDLEIEDTSYSVIELVIDGGAAIGQFGNIEELGSPAGTFSMEFNYYLRPKDGFGFVFSTENDFDKSKNPKITEEFDDGSGYSANINFFGLQYIRRHFFSEKLYLTYGPALGVQFIEDVKENDRNKRESSTDFAFSEKLMLNWRFHQWRTQTNEIMDFFTGVGIVHYWSPSPEVNGQSLSGNRLSALVRLGIGL